MSETIPVSIRSRGEYDLFSPDREKTQKLARHILYTVMFEIEDDDREAGRVFAEITKVPVLDGNGGAAYIEIGMKDEDAVTRFHMEGMMQHDQLYLQPSRLRLIKDQRTMRSGYFLNDNIEYEHMLEQMQLVGSTL